MFSGLHLFPFTKRKERPVRATCVVWQQQGGAETSCVAWGEKRSKAAARVGGLRAETSAEMAGQKWRHWCVVSGQLVFVFRASDWKLDHPDWTGRLRVTSKGKTAYIKLEDKVSGKGKAVAWQGCDWDCCF